jgi:hypothetical protein
VKWTQYEGTRGPRSCDRAQTSIELAVIELSRHNCALFSAKAGAMNEVEMDEITRE